jgi:hypothetical protein
MPRYAIKIHKTAARYLRALPANTRRRVRTPEPGKAGKQV